MGERKPKGPARSGSGDGNGRAATPRRRGSEAWYRGLVEKVPAVLYVDASDEESSAVYMSPRCEALLGYPQEEWLADPELWTRILHPDDRGRVLAAHDRARETGSVFREEYRLVARDGSVVWVRDEAAPLEGWGDGRRAGVLSDITDRKLHEESLRESEGRYRELFENAMEGIARISPGGGTIERCNPAYARALGLTPAETMGRSFFDFVDGEDEAEARRQRELRLSGVGSEYEVTIAAADGEERVLTCGGYPLYGEDGAYEGAVQTVSDVTDRRRHEEALKRSEERFRLVAGVTGEAIWDNDLATGVQEWDGATEALFGYPPRRRRTGGWWEERIHPEDRGRVLSGLAPVLERGEAWEEEYRFRRADGSYARVLDRARVVRDGAGRPVRMVGAMADVTERRRYEEELRRSEELFRRTFEAAAVGMAHLAPDGRWLRINDKLCEISGYARDELLSMNYSELTVPGDAGADRERIRRLLNGDIGSYSAEVRYVRKDGARLWVRLSVLLVRKLSGEPDYLICVMEDITRHKLLELVPDPLTQREIEVLQRIVEGDTDQKIALELRYSLGTVKLEIRHILAKLRARNRKQAAKRAVEIGLVPASRYRDRAGTKHGVANFLTG